MFSSLDPHSEIENLKSVSVALSQNPPKFTDFDQKTADFVVFIGFCGFWAKICRFWLKSMDFEKLVA